jgi:hypothetical protein
MGATVVTVQAAAVPLARTALEARETRVSAAALGTREAMGPPTVAVEVAAAAVAAPPRFAAVPSLRRTRS